MSALLWFLLGGAVALSLATAMRPRRTATRMFQTLAEAQAWALQMDDAGYDPFLRYEVRCYRRTKDTHA